MKKQTPGIRRDRRARAEQYQRTASDLFVSSDVDSSEERQALDTALVKAKRSLLLEPRNYETLVLIADIYSAIGEPDAAKAALENYDRAIRLQPQKPDAYSGKADLMMYQLDSPDDAEHVARKALKLSIGTGEEPEFLELRYASLIGILEARKKFAQARWLIREALKKCPSELMKGLAENTLKRIGHE